MKKTLALFIGLSAFLGSMLASVAMAAEVGDTIAATSLSNLYPDQTRVNRVINTPDNGLAFSILEFSSSSCEYCTENIPFVSNFAAETAAQATFRLVVIDRNAAAIDAYVKQHQDQFKFPVAYDTNRAAFKSAGFHYTPTFIVLDQNGKILFIHEGMLDNDAGNQIKDIIRK